MSETRDVEGLIARLRSREIHSGAVDGPVDPKAVYRTRPVALFEDAAEALSSLLEELRQAREERAQACSDCPGHDGSREHCCELVPPPKPYSGAGRRWKLGGYAPGSYECRCLICSATFTGDKRAVSCLPCAADQTESRALKAEEERKALVEAVRKIDRLTADRVSATLVGVNSIARAALSSLSEAADQPLPKTETTLREASDEG